ncbi:MAG TPA: hypothetical protein VMB75_04565 [Rhodocyclaceae bacterium]|nr:hypothetical protein [Rhodocyclaceae bacterium]
MDRPAPLVLALALLAPAIAAADQVVCHLSYGGEDKVVIAKPTTSPYTVPTIEVGSYFRFKVVFQKEPADQAAVKIYTYADKDEGAVPIHAVTYRYPPHGNGPYGFTGMHFVYEPVRDGELQYWCGLEPDGAAP